jgi:hypothetical protein
VAPEKLLDVKRFKADLYDLASRACRDEAGEVRSKVYRTADALVKLYRKNAVKINHSALELVCARELIRQGYAVKVEHRLSRSLVCDLIGEKGGRSVMVEIETGFIPPEAALEPSEYARGRIASKVARYSGFAERFALGTTPTYILDFPRFFVRPPHTRRREEAAEIKALVDKYYAKPPVSVEAVMRARLHSVFVVDVDAATAWERDPGSYADSASAFMGGYPRGPPAGEPEGDPAGAANRQTGRTPVPRSDI